MNSLMRSVLYVVFVLFGLGLVFYSVPAEATDNGCEAVCNAECNDLPKADREDCRLACFAGKCGNRGAMQKARKLGLKGILCEGGDGACNAFCEQGAVTDPDCAPAPFLRAVIPESVTAHSFFSMTLTILDANGQPDVGFPGTIHFKASDVGAQLPLDYTFTPSDRGTRVFPGAFKLAAEGVQDIVISEVGEPKRSAVVTISVAPRAVTSLPRF